MKTVGGIDEDAEAGTNTLEGTDDDAAADEVEQEIAADDAEEAEAVGATRATTDEAGETKS